MSAKSRLLLLGALLLLFGQPARSSAQDQFQPPPPLDPARFAGERVHARALEIATARRQNPALFETIAPYYEPRDNPIARLRNNMSRSRRRPPWTMQALPLDVFHSDHRVAAEQNPEAVNALANAILARRDAAAKALVDGVPDVLTLQDQYHEEMKKIREAHGLSPEEFTTLGVAASGGWDERVRLNPEYRVAWEEALLRDIPWGAKLRFLRMVVSFDHEESIPLFGQVLRDSMDAEINRRNRRAVTKCINHAFLALTERVCGECLAELIETVRSTTGPKHDEIRFGIGAAFAKAVGRAELRPNDDKILRLKFELPE